MNKKALSILSILFSAGALFAEGAAPAAGNAVIFFSSTVLAAGLGLGIAAGLCGLAMGLLIASALQGMARQPELLPKLQLNMLIGFALIEAQVLYVLFIAIILLFANPFTKFFM